MMIAIYTSLSDLFASSSSLAFSLSILPLVLPLFLPPFLSSLPSFPLFSLPSLLMVKRDILSNMKYILNLFFQVGALDYPLGLTIFLCLFHLIFYTLASFLSFIFSFLPRSPFPKDSQLNHGLFFSVWLSWCDYMWCYPLLVVPDSFPKSDTFHVLLPYAFPFSYSLSLSASILKHI